MPLELEYLPEYVFLNINDATNFQTGYYRWELPAQFFTNQRGSVSYVSFANGVLGSTIDSDIVVRWENGTMNHICSSNQTGAFLGSFSSLLKSNNANVYRANNSEPIKLLISSRPHNITLSFFDVECNPQDMDNSIIALKFEYLPPAEAVSSFQDTFYNKLNL